MSTQNLSSHSEIDLEGEFVDDDSLDGDPDGDRQLTSESDALDIGLNDSDLGASVAGDIGPKHL